MTLALDLSTDQGSVALLEDGCVIFDESFAAGRGHGGAVFGVLERALAAGSAPRRIVVGLGPGSYSGVRVAIAAALGLALGQGAELVGVPSVVGIADGHFLAVGDARRETFYFSEVRAGRCLVGPELLTREEFARRIEGAVLPIFGAALLAEAPALQLAFPQARLLATAPPAGFYRPPLEPIYLREAHITWPKPADK